MLPLCNRFVGRVFVSSLCDCMSGRKWYLLCNFFRIARQVRNCTCCAIFSVLHGRYEIVPAVQYFPYCVAGTKWYLLCIFYRFLPIFPYCTAGTWVFASRGVPLKTRSPKGPKNRSGTTPFWTPFWTIFHQNVPTVQCCGASFFLQPSRDTSGAAMRAPRAPRKPKRRPTASKMGAPGHPKTKKMRALGRNSAMYENYIIYYVFSTKSSPKIITFSLWEGLKTEAPQSIAQKRTK